MRVCIMCKMTLKINTPVVGCGSDDSDDVVCLECVSTVTRRDGSVGRDDYDPHADVYTDPIYQKTDEELLREIEDWRWHTRGF